MYVAVGVAARIACSGQMLRTRCQRACSLKASNCDATGYQATDQGQETPTVPTLFLAGTEGLNLHGNEWVEKINETPHSLALRFDGCHHWLMQQCASKVNNQIAVFLRRLTIHDFDPN